MTRVPIILSLIAAGLSCATSLAGILRPDTYARDPRTWAVQAVAQDWANLLAVAGLVWSAVVLRRGSPRALYVWLGCLLYLIYAFAIYAFAVRFNHLFLAYVAVLGLSFYALVGAVAQLDVTEATTPLRGQPHLAGAGNLLVIIGILFGGLWLSEDVPHVLANTPPASLAETGLLTNPVHVLDLAFFLPAMILAGVLTRRQNRWGLLFVVPLLVFVVAMGLAVLAVFALSAREGLPIAAPAAVAVAVIVVLGGVYATLLLRQQRGTSPP